MVVKIFLVTLAFYFSVPIVSEEILIRSKITPNYLEMLITILVVMVFVVVFLVFTVFKYYRCAKRFLSLLTYDSVSGLGNRKHVFDCLETLVNNKYYKKDRFSVLYLDIDDFKVINDTYGHIMGDNVIKHIAELSKMALRVTDIMGRVGGDEYLYIFPRTSAEEAEKISMRLLELIDRTPLLVSTEKIVRISVSMGVYHSSDRDNTVDEIYEAADKALYMSKGRGKNCLSVA